MIPASIHFVKQSSLCTSLCKDGYSVRTVEHLLSALEAKAVDNCRIEIVGSRVDDREVEVSVDDFNSVYIILDFDVLEKLIVVVVKCLRFQFLMDRLVRGWMPLTELESLRLWINLGRLLKNLRLI